MCYSFYFINYSCLTTYYLLPYFFCFCSDGTKAKKNTTTFLLLLSKLLLISIILEYEKKTFVNGLIFI